MSDLPNLMEIFAFLGDDNYVIWKKTATGTGNPVEVTFQPEAGTKFVILGGGQYNTDDTNTPDFMAYLTNGTSSCPISSPQVCNVGVGAGEGDSILWRSDFFAYHLITRTTYLKVIFGTDGSADIAVGKKREIALVGFYLPDFESSA